MRSTIAAVIILAAATYYLGYSHASSRYTAQIESIEASNSAALAQSSANLRAAEQRHADATRQLRDQYDIERAALQRAHDQAVTDLRNSSQRVRVPVTDCQPVPSPAAAASGTATAATAELDATVAADIYRIAADCDEIIHKYTALQNWAKEALKLCR